jgi:prepilin-type N-terminal cleavage/methylation domain-containing protein
MRRTRGFTLMELMIALALAGLVVGGAMQMHAAFNKQAARQNQLAEMQQTLRVSMLIIERALRSAGSGFVNPLYTEGGTGGSCTGSTQHFAFDWSDLNTYQDPITTRQSSTSYTDIDPDWFVVNTIDTSGAPIYSNGNSGANLQIVQTTPAPDLSSFNDGDLFEIVFPIGMTNCTVGGATKACSYLGSCIREVSAGSAHGGSSGTKFLQHNPSSSNTCFNPTPSSDDCTTSLNNLPSGQYATIRHLTATQTVYRVIPASGDALSSGTPRLAMRTAPFKTPYSSTTYPWTVIADNIEDMQIAVIAGAPTRTGLTDNTGTVCSSVDSGIPPTGCDPGSVAVVRVTLTARSSSPVIGATVGASGSLPPIGAEDEAVTSPTDGYLRRSLTAEIQMRNINGSP